MMSCHETSPLLPVITSSPIIVGGGRDEPSRVAAEQSPYYCQLDPESPTSAIFSSQDDDRDAATIIHSTRRPPPLTVGERLLLVTVGTLVVLTICAGYSVVQWQGNNHTTMFHQLLAPSELSPTMSLP